MMNADSVVRRQGHQPLRMADDPGMDSAGEGHSPTTKQADMILGPVVGALVMQSENVVAQRKRIDIRLRMSQLRPNPLVRPGTEALIVVQEQNPFVTAQ